MGLLVATTVTLFLLNLREYPGVLLGVIDYVEDQIDNEEVPANIQDEELSKL